MRRLLLMFGIVFAILFVTGCGGGGGAKEEVKKDAEYYKKELRKATSIKALHTDKRVLFTIKSLKNSFVNEFNINGTDEATNKAIVAKFKSNFEDEIKENTGYDFNIKDDTAILMPSINEKDDVPYKFADMLKEAISLECSGCNEDDVDEWFKNNQASLEKSMQEQSGIDESDDIQPLCVSDLEPPPLPMLIIGTLPKPVVPDVNTSKPLELRWFVDEYDSNIGNLVP